MAGLVGVSDPRGPIHEAVAWLGLAKLAKAIVHYLHQEHGRHPSRHQAGQYPPGRPRRAPAPRFPPGARPERTRPRPGRPEWRDPAVHGPRATPGLPRPRTAGKTSGKRRTSTRSAWSSRETGHGARSPTVPDPDATAPPGDQSGLYWIAGKSPPVPVREVEPSIPPSLGSIIDQCLALRRPGIVTRRPRALADDPPNRFLGRRPLEIGRPIPSVDRAGLVNWVGSELAEEGRSWASRSLLVA